MIGTTLGPVCSNDNIGNVRFNGLLMTKIARGLRNDQPADLVGQFNELGSEALDQMPVHVAGQRWLSFQPGSQSKSHSVLLLTSGRTMRH